MVLISFEEARERIPNAKKIVFTGTPVKIQKRDYSDIHKEFGALKKAEDAIEVDTTYMSVEEVVNYIILQVKELVK